MALEIGMEPLASILRRVMAALRARLRRPDSTATSGVRPRMNPTNARNRVPAKQPKPEGGS